MTAAGVHRASAASAPARGRRGPAGLRLAALYAASRRVLACLLVLVACAIALRTALHWLPRSGVFSRQIPLIIEAAAAAVIGVTTRSPFGEPERATGRWLPFLRLGTCLALTGAAVGALAMGAAPHLAGADLGAASPLAGGDLGLLRDVAGFTGIALLTAALLGGALAWIGPVGYLGITLPALSSRWATPWVWPARPPHDHGAAICAALVLAAGLAFITLRGARDSVRE